MADISKGFVVIFQNRQQSSTAQSNTHLSLSLFSAKFFKLFKQASLSTKLCITKSSSFQTINLYTTITLKQLGSISGAALEQIGSSFGSSSGVGQAQLKSLVSRVPQALFKQYPFLEQHVYSPWITQFFSQISLQYLNNPDLNNANFLWSQKSCYSWSPCTHS